MYNFNKVIMMGRLTKDPAFSTGTSGVDCARIRIACNEDRENGKAHFFDCVAFGENAKSINNNFYKGRPIFIEGRLEQNEWESDKGKVYSVRIKIDRWQFVDARKEQEGTSATTSEPIVAGISEFGDDLEI